MTIILLINDHYIQNCRLRAGKVEGRKKSEKGTERKKNDRKKNEREESNLKIM